MKALIAHRASVAVVVAAALAITGCGSSSAPTGTTGGGANENNTARLLSFVRCARTHGIPDLSDPGSRPPRSGSSSQPVLVLMSISFPAGITPQSPAFQSAMQACKHRLPNGGPRPQISAGQRRRMIAAAQCMRTHGAPTFPDPVFTPHGIKVGGPSVDPQSPAFQRAAKACGNF